MNRDISEFRYFCLNPKRDTKPQMSQAGTHQNQFLKGQLPVWVTAGRWCQGLVWVGKDVKSHLIAPLHGRDTLHRPGCSDFHATRPPSEENCGEKAQIFPHPGLAAGTGSPEFPQSEEKGGFKFNTSTLDMGKVHTGNSHLGGLRGKGSPRKNY